jgi:hypothetical protein
LALVACGKNELYMLLIEKTLIGHLCPLENMDKQLPLISTTLLMSLLVLLILELLF